MNDLLAQVVELARINPQLSDQLRSAVLDLGIAIGEARQSHWVRAEDIARLRLDVDRCLREVRRTFTGLGHLLAPDIRRAALQLLRVYLKNSNV